MLFRVPTQIGQWIVSRLFDYYCTGAPSHSTIPLTLHYLPDDRLLTGTPIQNNTVELFAILNFLLPHIFALEQLEAMEAVSGIDAQRVKRIIAPFVLRRLKSEVLGQLVPKAERTERLPLLAAQQTTYETVIREYAEKKEKRQQLLGGAKQLEHVFTELRKVANHPLLTRTRANFSDATFGAIASYMHQCGGFGHAASLDQVRKELVTCVPSSCPYHSLPSDPNCRFSLSSHCWPSMAIAVQYRQQPPYLSRYRSLSHQQCFACGRSPGALFAFAPPHALPLSRFQVLRL